MSVEWVDTLTDQLKRVRAMSEDLTDDLADGAQYVLEGAVARVPKRSGNLASSGRIDKSRGGINTVAVTFDGPYARWIHEHLWFQHPDGGQAKFLERSLRMRSRGAMKRAANHFWERL